MSKIEKLSTDRLELSQQIRREGEQAKDVTNKLIRQLKQKTPKDLDDQTHKAHEEVFEKIDCLTCGNCCKTTSPVFTLNDVDRISKRLKMKPSAFTEKYLTADLDNDLVLKTAPCSFLDEDNSCLIYSDRPTACRTYPHTDRKRIYQLLDLTYENSFICPAVQGVLKKLSSIYIKPN
jgi:uncharacterized protein